MRNEKKDEQRIVSIDRIVKEAAAHPVTLRRPFWREIGRGFAFYPNIDPPTPKIALPAAMYRHIPEGGFIDVSNRDRTVVMYRAGLGQYRLAYYNVATEDFEPRGRVFNLDPRSMYPEGPLQVMSFPLEENLYGIRDLLPDYVHRKEEDYEKNALKRRTAISVVHGFMSQQGIVEVGDVQRCGGVLCVPYRKYIPAADVETRIEEETVSVGGDKQHPPKP